jgi:type IV secretory pathway VirB10-like protein
MSTQYDRLIREYHIPPGAVTPEELRLLEQGGIRLVDSDDERDAPQPPINPQPTNKTKPRLPNPQPTSSSSEVEALKQIYENELSKKDKQIWYLQNEVAHREKVWEVERGRMDQEHGMEVEKVLGELRRARAQVLHSEGQIPLIKEAINKVKEMLAGIESESVYLRMRDIPDRDLPPSEWLLVNVWELVHPYKK